MPERKNMSQTHQSSDCILSKFRSGAPYSEVKPHRSSVTEVMHVIEHDAIVDDEFIKWLFKDKNGDLSSALLRRISHQSMKWTPLDYRIAEYLDNRYSDSTCRKETIHRIFRGIDVHPICEYCQKNPVKFVASSGILFNRFCCSSCSSKSETTIKARERKCVELYGDPTFNNTDQFKKTCMERYGVINVFQAEWCKTAAKSTMIERYGVDNIAKSPSAWERRRKTTLYPAMQRAFETRRRNGTLNSSHAEDRVYERMCEVFGNDDVYRNWKQDKRYPFACDFYIPSRDLFIECNFFWMHGGKFFDPDNDMDVIKRSVWEERAKTKKGYAVGLYTWTDLDQRKMKTAITNELRYIVFWRECEAIEWLNNMISSVSTSTITDN